MSFNKRAMFRRLICWFKKPPEEPPEEPLECQHRYSVSPFYALGAQMDDEVFKCILCGEKTEPMTGILER